MLGLHKANVPFSLPVQVKHGIVACSDGRPSSGDPADAVLGRVSCQTLVGARQTLTAGEKVANAALYINISNHKHTRRWRLTS